MKIALAFSGGGYRASAFSLGTLTYLDKIKITTRSPERSLLSEVSVLSTVSGGTITGARYAVGIKKGESLSEIYALLYKFFLEVDLVSDATKLLNSPTHWQEKTRSLINAFADIYDQRLFDREKFGVLLDPDHPIHLKHISFNATEFTNGLQFRFLVSDAQERGKIGNAHIEISEKVAKEIRMADILAASSCFPVGFEPINFPADFSLSSHQADCVGLMDGGIVDNQGIAPILLAEKRMRKQSGKSDCELDLIIISDVSSPYMEGFKANVQHKENWWRQLTIQKIQGSAFVLSFLSVIAVVFTCNIWVAMAATFFVTVSVMLLGIIGCIRKIVKKNKLIEPEKLKKFLQVKLGVFEDLFINRRNSVLQLIGSVFMKHIRRLNFKQVYENDLWKNRRIMHAIYELMPKTVKSRMEAGTIPHPFLEPTPSIQDVSEIAYNMGTTLWFHARHREEKTLDAIIACGQYTVCWNLLEYIERLKANGDNTNESHTEFLACEQALRADWEKFQQDPYWFLKQYHAECMG